jgi:regulator of protease activity HflC (stomatin/prohibitin superfamily)
MTRLPVFRRTLGSEECAVVLRRHGEPLLVRGPGSVRTFYRWRQVSVVNLSPFVANAVDTNVTTNDGVAVTVRGELEGQVDDPVAAALKVVDYEDATRQILHTAVRALVMERSSAELSEGRQPHPHVADEVVDALRSWGVVVLSLRFDVAAAADG